MKKTLILLTLFSLTLSANAAEQKLEVNKIHKPAVQARKIDQRMHRDMIFEQR